MEASLVSQAWWHSIVEARIVWAWVEESESEAKWAQVLPGEAAAVSGMAGQCQGQTKFKEIRFIHSLVCLFIQNGENREKAQLWKCWGEMIGSLSCIAWRISSCSKAGEAWTVSGLWETGLSEAHVLTSLLYLQHHCSLLSSVPMERAISVLKFHKSTRLDPQGSRSYVTLNLARIMKCAEWLSPAAYGGSALSTPVGWE